MDFKALLNTTKMFLKKNGPTIGFIGGAVATVAGTVIAIKATADHYHDIVDEHKEAVETINAAAEAGQIGKAKEGSEGLEIVPYTNKDKRNDLVKTYAKTGWNFTKAYWLPALLTIGGYFSMGASFKTLHKRNVSLAAAYTGLEIAYAKYREKIKQMYGEDADRQAKYSPMEDVVSEDGEILGVKHDEYEAYDTSKIFDDMTAPFTFKRDVYTNENFIRCQEDAANFRLKSRGKGGWLSLNDIYEMLGFPKTQLGQLVGWMYDPDDDTKQNCIKFKLIGHNGEVMTHQEYIYNKEPIVRIDFNVDKGTFLGNKLIEKY